MFRPLSLVSRYWMINESTQEKKNRTVFVCVLYFDNFFSQALSIAGMLNKVLYQQDWLTFVVFAVPFS